VRDPQNLPSLEGPKLYKKNGYYYIFAPFGGVGTGAQAVLRSKSIYGPYEHRVVLQRGSTNVNGPHQGGYVESQDGKGWFIHFQSRGGHGRIDHLEPVRWEDDWPIMGEAAAGATAGQPVSTGPVPVHRGKNSGQRPQTSDEFSEKELGLQWEWNHNPDDAHWSLTERRGYLRLKPGFAPDLLAARNTLTQMMQDEAFEFTSRLDVTGMKDGDHAGIAMFEQSASGLQVVQSGGMRALSFFHAQDAVDNLHSCRAESFCCACASTEIVLPIPTAWMMEDRSRRLENRRGSHSVGGRGPGRRSLPIPQRIPPTQDMWISIGHTTRHSNQFFPKET
jgi:hypothetical protein